MKTSAGSASPLQGSPQSKKQPFTKKGQGSSNQKMMSPIRKVPFDLTTDEPGQDLDKLERDL